MFGLVGAVAPYKLGDELRKAVGFPSGEQNVTVCPLAMRLILAISF